MVEVPDDNEGENELDKLMGSLKKQKITPSVEKQDGQFKMK